MLLQYADIGIAMLDIFYRPHFVVEAFALALSLLYGISFSGLLEEGDRRRCRRTGFAGDGKDLVRKSGW